MTNKTRVSGVYRIYCASTDKAYIGSSFCMAERWRHHRAKLQHGTHRNAYLQAAWDKHGADAFVFEVVELVEADRLVEREQYWISTARSSERAKGYNILSTADRSGGDYNGFLGGAPKKGNVRLVCLVQPATRALIDGESERTGETLGEVVDRLLQKPDKDDA